MIKDIAKKLGIEDEFVAERPWKGRVLTATSPIDGDALGLLHHCERDMVSGTVEASMDAFDSWRKVPAPQRGEVVRQIGNEFRRLKEPLAQLICLESGKIMQEALGEVQEVIDICDFAVGLSRQLYGLNIASERPQHRLAEQWHPLGPIGVISAFNFPMAVWAWNAMIGLVCGDTIIWKPSEKTSICAVACIHLVRQVIKRTPEAHIAIVNIMMGDGEIGHLMAEDKNLPLISATGSVSMGRSVAQTVAKRLGRSLLELGGNNAMILTESANLDLAIPAIVFSAVGTAGQRCTSLRRLIMHESIFNKVGAKLAEIYDSIKVGNPFDKDTLVGPLIDEQAYENMQAVMKQHTVTHGGQRLTKDVPQGGAYVKPALITADYGSPTVKNETFAPILYMLGYKDLEEAIEIQNDVPQGLSSSIFTEKMREAELFCSATGSDCGIANVNVGTSGAEIGGAFGGEKDTGGGRESGSDSWKAYMRRQTNTINYSEEMPLSQGIKFDV